MAIKDDIKIGKSYRFAYPPEFMTLPDYSAHRGATVTVVRQLSQREADQGAGMERMFRVIASDGWTGDAWASELE